MIMTSVALGYYRKCDYFFAFPALGLAGTAAGVGVAPAAAAGTGVAGALALPACEVRLRNDEKILIIYDLRQAWWWGRRWGQTS